MSNCFALMTSDGVEISVHCWLPPSPMRAVVQVSHGASEHAARYARLAAVLNDAGFGVYADDHRGHGRTAGTLERFGVAGTDAWNRMIADARELTTHIEKTHPGLPIVLLGHSMGSFIAQGYLQGGTDRLAAAALSGSAASLSEAAVGLAERLETAIAAEGRDVPSMDFALLFVDFNNAFVDGAPATGPTGFEWLSRDADEVQLYVDDPWCGNPLSNGFVADMAAGLDNIFMSGRDNTVEPKIPVLVIAGSEDPVGERGASVRQLSERYRQAGFPVTEKIYEGARHEIFNETNRDEVHADLLAWLDTVVP